MTYYVTYRWVVLWDGLGAWFPLTLFVGLLEAIDVTRITTNCRKIKMDMILIHNIHVLLCQKVRTGSNWDILIDKIK